MIKCDSNGIQLKGLNVDILSEYAMVTYHIIQATMEELHVSRATAKRMIKGACELGTLTLSELDNELETKRSIRKSMSDVDNKFSSIVPENITTDKLEAINKAIAEINSILGELNND